MCMAGGRGGTGSGPCVEEVMSHPALPPEPLGRFAALVLAEVGFPWRSRFVVIEAAYLTSENRSGSETSSFAHPVREKPRGPWSSAGLSCECTGWEDAKKHTGACW